MLDIVYAALLSLIAGGTVGGMLRSVVSGPFGDDARTWGLAGAVVGLAVHFAIMAVMVLAYGRFVRTGRLAALSPWIAGTLYGLALYLLMYWIVLPLRFPTVHPVTAPADVAKALFAHIALVGIPMALIAHRHFSKGPSQ